MTAAEFQHIVWQYYERHGRRELPWRAPEPDGKFDPYKIMVSELMLQQTQVSRVVPKYWQFLERFPDVSRLASAPLGDVLIAWQGLGYNRRAKFLWQAAQMVEGQMAGEFPSSQTELTALPGVGVNTAGAIAAYAYNQPVVFVETNVRTVIIHHYFNDHFEKLASGGPAVNDAQIKEVVARTLPPKDAREWYWALMDYGTHIKQQFGNKSRASKSYSKQSPFEGSRRKVRGAVIRYLSQQPTRLVGLEELAAAEPDARLTQVLDDLVREHLIRQESGRYRLS